MVIALLLSLFIMWRLYKNNLAFLRFRVTLEDFFDSVLIFFVSFGIGARILHIIEHADSFGIDIFRYLLFLHYPGFSFLGGVIGGFLGLWLFCRHQKKPFLLLADLLSIGLALTLSLSRIGSLLTGDGFGKPTSFPINVSLPTIPGTRHPTQLYEALLTFAIFALLFVLYRKGRGRDGDIFVYFVGLLGLTRFFVEFLRADSVYFHGVAVAQILSVIFVVIAAVVLVVRKGDVMKATAYSLITKVKHE